jgi:hypothetical protein
MTLALGPPILSEILIPTEFDRLYEDLRLGAQFAEIVHDLVESKGANCPDRLRGASRRRPFRAVYPGSEKIKLSERLSAG